MELFRLSGVLMETELSDFCHYLKNMKLAQELAAKICGTGVWKRVLKDTGSLYLHCDPTASHYLKVMLDAIFGRSG
jgi:hypothetical protein